MLALGEDGPITVLITDHTGLITTIVLGAATLGGVVTVGEAVITAVTVGEADMAATAGEAEIAWAVTIMGQEVVDFMEVDTVAADSMAVADFTVVEVAGSMAVEADFMAVVADTTGKLLLKEKINS
jgi:hypothetical protein